MMLVKGYAIHLSDYNPTPDGSGDNRAALTTAVTDAQARGIPLFIPGGSYSFTGTIPITSGLRVIGAGRASTILQMVGASQTGFSINTPAPVCFEHLRFDSGNTGQTAITVSASTENTLSSFSDLQINSFAVGLDFQRASLWNVRNCHIQSGASGRAGISVANGNNVDSGDSSISDCIFIGNNSSAVGISQVSSGGLRISNCKFNTGGWGYLLSLAPGANTSDLMVGNCSFENMGSGAIGFNRQSTTGGFSNISINGCQFALNTATVVQGDTTAGWLSNVSVTGCPMVKPLQMPSIAGTGLLLDGVKQ